MRVEVEVCVGNIEFWQRAFPEIEEAPPPWAALRDRLHLPATDAEEAESSGGSNDTIGHAEGQSFAIEYVDANGNDSVRRITVWAVKRRGNGAVVLIAKCHERGAQRSFRVDRIKAAIDLDGEVYEPPHDFLAEVLGIDADMPSAGPGDDEVADLRRATARLRDEIRLLATLAHADGQMDEREADEILIYCDWRLGQVDTMLGPWGLAQLKRYIIRLRPTRAMVTDSIDRLLDRCSPDDLKRLFMAAHAVVKADGKILTSELEALEELYLELTGLPLQLSHAEDT